MHSTGRVEELGLEGLASRVIKRDKSCTFLPNPRRFSPSFLHKPLHRRFNACNTLMNKRYTRVLRQYCVTAMRGKNTTHLFL